MARKACKFPTDCTGPAARGRCLRCSPRSEAEAEKIAAAVKANWQDPAFRERNAAATKANWQDPAFRERNAAAVKANWQDPAFREKQAAATKANWQDPAFREKQAAATKAYHAGCKGVEIPRWVPDDLRDEYLDAAAWQGEEFAASHCRRLKSEARAC